MVQIRTAGVGDRDAIWAILEPVIRAGEPYALPRDMSRCDALAYWLGADRTAFVAEDGGGVVGTCYLRANASGGGGHVCNCGFITGVTARGRGVAKAMCHHALSAARHAGFRAMQFNCVVSTNTAAIALWQTLGFEIVGRLPGAFAHPRNGDVDAFVMYRRL